jgi:hypothetical protein
MLGVRWNDYYLGANWPTVRINLAPGHIWVAEMRLSHAHAEHASTSCPLLTGIFFCFLPSSRYSHELEGSSKFCILRKLEEDAKGTLVSR